MSSNADGITAFPAARNMSHQCRIHHKISSPEEDITAFPATAIQGSMQHFHQRRRYHSISGNSEDVTAFPAAQNIAQQLQRSRVHRSMHSNRDDAVMFAGQHLHLRRRHHSASSAAEDITAFPAIPKNFQSFKQK